MTREEVVGLLGRANALLVEVPDGWPRLSALSKIQVELRDAIPGLGPLNPTEGELLAVATRLNRAYVDAVRAGDALLALDVICECLGVRP